MEEQIRPSRYKKKRLRKGRFLLILLLILIVVIVGYGINEYRSGLKFASETKLPKEEFIADENVNKIENYLILGVDSRGEEKSRTDTMMLLSWNRDTNDMKLVPFMRDIYAEIKSALSEAET